MWNCFTCNRNQEAITFRSCAVLEFMMVTTTWTAAAKCTHRRPHAIAADRRQLPPTTLYTAHHRFLLHSLATVMDWMALPWRKRSSSRAEIFLSGDFSDSLWFPFNFAHAKLRESIEQHHFEICHHPSVGNLALCSPKKEQLNSMAHKLKLTNRANEE